MRTGPARDGDQAGIGVSVEHAGPGAARTLGQHQLHRRLVGETFADRQADGLQGGRMQPALGDEPAGSPTPSGLAVEGLGPDLSLAEGAVLLEPGREGQGRARRSGEPEGGGVDHAGEIRLLDRLLAARELRHILQRTTVRTELDGSLRRETLARAFQLHGGGLQGQAEGGVGDLGVLHRTLVGDLEVAQAIVEIAAERKGHLALAAQAGRLEAVAAGHAAGGLVDHLQELAGVPRRLAVDEEALVGPRQARDLDQAL